MDGAVCIQIPPGDVRFILGCRHNPTFRFTPAQARTFASSLLTFAEKAEAGIEDLADSEKLTA